MTIYARLLVTIFLQTQVTGTPGGLAWSKVTYIGNHYGQIGAHHPYTHLIHMAWDDERLQTCLSYN